MNENRFNTKAKQWFNTNFELLESVFALTFLGAFIFKTMGFPQLAIAMLIAINMLTLLYILKGSLTSTEEKLDEKVIFLNKIAFYGMAISLVGILFKLFSWPNADQMLMMGMISIAILSVFVLFMRSKGSNVTLFREKYLFRLIFVFALVIALKFIPRTQLEQWKIIDKPYVTERK